MIDAGQLWHALLPDLNRARFGVSQFCAFSNSEVFGDGVADVLEGFGLGGALGPTSGERGTPDGVTLVALEDLHLISHPVRAPGVNPKPRPPCRSRSASSRTRAGR